MKFFGRSNDTTAEEHKPHLWILHEKTMTGGIMRFLLREGELSEGLGFERMLIQIPGVFSVRAYETYLAMEWTIYHGGAKLASLSFTPIPEAKLAEGLEAIYESLEMVITEVALRLLGEYFNWQEPIRSARLDSYMERDDLRRREGLMGRWIFGDR
jgi:hypothetical protein